ncbi:uncharacterized protein ARMOST_16774 [Armillaria ostoyae]|uniref:Uncharacterized protein n=1 Tax=Armillaria ostoyae TaxID=47428 RepID=A0A284RX48_ARMOS|nr:uncharacterized protein ARMOST_16774 [Armillaria ostoyae]
MGNAQEAIAEYEVKMGSNERVSVVKIATSRSPLAMKWVKNPDVTLFENYLIEYWSNYEYHSLQRTEP